MARRNKTCIDPLSAFGLVAGAFVAGVVTERAAKVSHKTQKKAEKEGKRLARAASKRLDKISRNGFGGKDTRAEVLDTFYDHSRISPKTVNKGFLDLFFFVFPDRDAYEDADEPTGPHHMDDMSEWVKVKPGNVVEVFVSDPNDPDAEISEKDTLAILVEGMTHDLKDSLARYEEEQYGRAERSHKGNRRRRNRK